MNIAVYLKLLLKPREAGLCILFLHVCNDHSQFMGNHSSVSTAQVVIEGIMDEGILVLYGERTSLLTTLVLELELHTLVAQSFVPCIQHLVASFVQQKFVIEAIRGGKEKPGSHKVFRFLDSVLERMQIITMVA